MADQYTREGRDFKYIAARMGGMMEPLPYWFKLLLPLGLIRFDDNGNVEVITITGAWQLVMPGDWVVLQKGTTVPYPDPKAYIVWHVEHEDFIKVWTKVEKVCTQV